MIDIIKNLVKGKKVLLLGFGREGKSSFRLLIRAGGFSSLTIADLNDITEEDIHSSIHGYEADIAYIQKITGESYQDSLNEFDIVIKSPGIVLKQDATFYTCKILSQTQLFFHAYRNQIIGITGTKGKSTTTTLLYHILKESGIPVVIAGNIGIPVFDIADDITKDTIIVLELSSHQLEYMTISPRIGVLLNIHEEHLDHYGTMEKYVAAKQRIYLYQAIGDMLFCNIQNLPKKGTCKAYITSIGDTPQADLQIQESSIRYNGHQITILPEDIKLVGHHNYYDIAAVYAISQKFGISEEQFLQSLKSYEPLPHRLQMVGIVDGVTYYDDSISTICDTTIQALESLKNTDTVLIGGMDRGIEYNELIEYLSSSSVSHIILMSDTGARIYKEIMEDYQTFHAKERLILVNTLEEAVDCAKKVTEKGKCCVLSPAAASYGIFKNFEERGEVFQKLLNSSNMIE